MNSDLDRQIQSICERTIITSSLDNPPSIDPLEDQLLRAYEQKKERYEELFELTDTSCAVRIINVRDLLSVEETERFVALSYKRILGRKPDAEGLRAWVSSLKNNTFSRQQALLEMAFCPEGVSRHIRLTGFEELPLSEFDRFSGRDYISYAYILMLGRPVDSDGMEQYISQLRGNIITKEEFLYILQNSAEGISHAPRVIGLDEAYRKRIRRKKLLSIPVFGRTARFLLNLFRMSRRVNILDARLYALQDSMEWELNELNQKLNASHQRERELEGQLHAAESRVAELEEQLKKTMNRMETK